MTATVFGTLVIPEVGIRTQSEISCSRGWLSIVLQLSQQRYTLSIFPSELLASRFWSRFLEREAITTEA